MRKKRDQDTGVLRAGGNTQRSFALKTHQDDKVETMPPRNSETLRL
jgi:hypothetical protein